MLASVESIGGKWLQLQWQDGCEARFPAIWLRDNLTQSLHKQDGQRLFDIADLPEDLSLTDASLDSKGRVEIIFAPENLTAHFDPDWLRAHVVGSDAAQTSPLRLWGDIAKDKDTLLQATPWSELRDNESTLLNWLEHIEVYGFALVSEMEKKSGALFDVVARFGFVRETNYGRLFDVRTSNDPDNLAFSSAGLGLHTDNPYRDPVPGLQLLHCLENSDDGGATLLRDGFHAAETLRSEHPDDFALLSKTLVRFRYREEGTILEHAAPMIECDAEGALQTIRYNNRSIAPLRLPVEEIESFYRAYRRFSGVLRREKDTLMFPLHPGELLLMDNRRTLHGRTEFAGGTRHLQGCYADKDGLLSTLRWLRRQ